MAKNSMSSKNEETNQDSDDIPCDICQAKDGEDGNEIVFCDGCSVCVHQACYGIVSIPNGPWFCRPCEKKAIEAQCVLCPNKEGAMKPTSDGKWCHVSCALWIPEISFGDCDLIEPINGANDIPKARKNLVCCLCKQKGIGAAIQCSIKKCYSAYHVTCARKHKLLFQQKIINGVLENKSYCQKHSSKDGIKSEDDEILIEKENLYKSESKINQRLSPDQKSFIEKLNMTEIYKSVRRRLRALSTNPKEIPLYTVEMLDAIFAYWKIRLVLNFGQPLINCMPKVWLEDRISNNNHKLDFKKLPTKVKEISGKNISMNSGRKNRTTEKSDEENIMPSPEVENLSKKSRIEIVSNPQKVVRKLDQTKPQDESPPIQEPVLQYKFVTGNMIVDKVSPKNLIFDNKIKKQIKNNLNFAIFKKNPSSLQLSSPKKDLNLRKIFESFKRCYSDYVILPTLEDESLEPLTVQSRKRPPSPIYSETPLKQSSNVNKSHFLQRTLDFFQPKLKSHKNNSHSQ